MPKKRGRDSVINLTNSSDEDSDEGDWTSPAASRSKKSRLPSSGGGAIAPSKFSLPTDGDELSPAQRMAQASSFLAPRSSLFGGQGTSIEHGKMTPSDSPKGSKRKMKALKPTPAADGLLNFAPVNDAASAKKRLDSLTYGKATLIYTTPTGKRGRKKGEGKKKKVVKGKGKKKADSSDEEHPSDDGDSSDDEEELDPADRVNWDKIVGKDPDKDIQRALVASPTMQLPWIPCKFATEKTTKVHETKINLPQAEYEKREEARKKRSGRAPGKTRLYVNKIPLFLLHQEELEECANLEKWTEVQTKRVEDELPNGKKGGLGAKFALLTCRDEHNRLYLRFAVYCADNDARQWASTENAIWIKDFPLLAPASSTVPDNPTHTRFSAALWRFLNSPSFALSSVAVGKRLLDDFRLFDFSTSSEIQLVTSRAGVWEGEEEIEKGGGFDSLARAMEALEPRPGGKWKVEYLTPVGALPSPVRFLPRLYAACKGVSPLEYIAQTDSQTSTAAETARDEYKAGKVLLVYPTESTVSQTKEGKGEAQYHLRWEGPDYEAAAKEAKGVLRDCVLENGRVNHSNMILILHQPNGKDKDDEDDEQYEAFLYIGSHAPTPASWGSFSSSTSLPTMTIQTTDLGILYRCATSSTWAGLLKQVKEIMPNKRPLEEYGRRDDPHPTVERPPPKEEKQKKVGRPKKKQKKGDESD